MSSAVPSEIANGKSLPFELILVCLPVKSLKRFRAVEKSWRSLIDSEKFAKTHLRRSLQTNSNRHLISGIRGFYRTGLDSVDELESMDLDFKYNDRDNFAVSNSIDGMFVVKRDPEPLILFNPFTREYKVLPNCPSLDFHPTDPIKISYGFGYDSKSEDYKVIKTIMRKQPLTSVYTEGQGHPTFVYTEEYIYGLKSDYWRRINSTRHIKGPWPTHVNGVLHTLIHTGRVDEIILMGYSVETEEDYEVPLPEVEMTGLDFCFLEVFNGCLALVCNYGCSFVMWVMEEYGVKESWKVLLSFPGDPNQFVRPFVYPKERETVVINIIETTLTVFGSKTNTVKKIDVPFTFAPRLCVETLISPNCWNKTNDKKNSFTKKQNKKGKKEVMKKKKKNNNNNNNNNNKRDDFLSSGFKLVL